MQHVSPRQFLAASLSLLLLLSFLMPFPAPGKVWAEETDLLPNADLSNVAMRLNGLQLSEELKQQLAEDLFAVVESSNSFSGIYEMGAYMQKPLFITVDAMLHLHHLLFAHLLKDTEDLYLYGKNLALSQKMFGLLQAQLEELRGSSFEAAALTNLAFISVGNALLDKNFKVPEEVRKLVEEELALIYSAQGIAPTPLFMRYSTEEISYEDYSQYKPRGYYSRSPEMEAYFRALMWYGRINFSNKDDLRNRCGLLMSLALAQNPEVREIWDQIYDVSALFAGQSDDLGYRDFLPLIDEVYGEEPALADIAEKASLWTDFHTACQKMQGPRIYSEARERVKPDEEAEKAIGFRFMGQRFSADQEIFGKLIFDAVDKNPKEELRGLPDVLDVMAAFGSEKALELLKAQGAEEFERYPENMAELRKLYADSEKLPKADNLAAAWLDSLRPLLRDKSQEENLPAFMKSEKWARKDLECFAGSFTELKHDTILYAKQVMAEMGGFFEEKLDDRGYVQPEPEIFRKLAELSRSSGEKLQQFGMLSVNDAELVERVAKLAERLAEIAEKERLGTLPSDEDFAFIRAFGGNLESLSMLCTASVHDEIPDGDKPAIVADVATDPNEGAVLELALGNPEELWVIVPVDGSLRLAFGAVYNFYQFKQPLNERLSDEEWRTRIGAEPQWDDEGNFIMPDLSGIPEKPSWTQDYRQKKPAYQPEAALPARERLPHWAFLRSGQKLSADARLSARFSEGSADVFDKEGKLIWSSPENYLVQDLHFLDIDRDSREDLLLLCWKEGRYGSHHPFG